MSLSTLIMYFYLERSTGICLRALFDEMAWLYEISRCAFRTLANIFDIFQIIFTINSRKVSLSVSVKNVCIFDQTSFFNHFVATQSLQDPRQGWAVSHIESSMERIIATSDSDYPLT